MVYVPFAMCRSSKKTQNSWLFGRVGVKFDSVATMCGLSSIPGGFRNSTKSERFQPSQEHRCYGGPPISMSYISNVISKSFSDSIDFITTAFDYLLDVLDGTLKNCHKGSQLGNCPLDIRRLLYSTESRAHWSKSGPSDFRC